jgi:predicted ester cyclase
MNLVRQKSFQDDRSRCVAGPAAEMEGWLEKEGHTFKSWKRRYMVIGGEVEGVGNENSSCSSYVLSYYQDETLKSKYGEMFLTKNTALSNLLDGHVTGRNNLFVILSTENKGHNYLLLSAATPEEKIQWMRKIQEIIDLQSTSIGRILDSNINIIHNDQAHHHTGSADGGGDKIVGWLEKEGKLIKSWKRRWMVFDPQSMILSYFVESDSIFKKGEFKLSNQSTISPLKNGFSPGKVNLFVITSTFDRESILLSASTIEDRNRWISGIQKHLFKHQKFPKNISSKHHLSFPVTEIPPCTIEDIRTIQMLYSDILTAPVSSSPFDDFSETPNPIEFFFDQYFSDDYVEFNGSYDLRNKISFLHQVENWWLSIPDIQWSIQDLAVDGNKVAVWVIIRGSPVGTFRDLVDLDGTVSFIIMGISIFTFVHGQLKCTYHLEDWNDAVQQIKNRVTTSHPLPNLLSISPSKAPHEILLSRTPSIAGDRVMSMSLRESSFDILSSMLVPPVER